MGLLKNRSHKCIQENLCAYIDGELNASEAAAVEAHLASCPECAWEKKTLEQTSLLLSQAPTLAVPRSFVVREAQVSAPAKTGFFTSARMVYLRGATAAAGVLLAAVVAGDAWLRPVVMPMAAAPAAQADMATFGVTAEALPTDQAMLKAAPPPAEPQPEGTAAPTVAETPIAAPTDAVRGVGAGPAATPEIAGSEFAVREQGETRASVWSDIRIWRVAEGALGAMFVALLALTATGWRKIARLG